MLVQTHLIKMNPEFDHMTKAEQRYFKKMNKNNSFSMFRLGKCEVCEKLIPKAKKYCSIECKEEKEYVEDVSEELDG
jgi:hypothetical protein